MAAPTYPGWVDELTDAALVRHFGRTTLERGREYARTGRVGHIAVGSGTRGTLAQATVRGSHYRVYQTVLRFDTATALLGSSCSCPMRVACKHAAAVLLQMRAANQRAATPAWQQALASVNDQARRVTGGAALAIQITRTGVSVQLRPLQWGKSGRWVRSGITWDTVSNPWGGLYNEPQRRILAQVKRAHRGSDYSYAGRSDVLALTELRADIWPLLKQAGLAGIPLVPGENTPPITLLDSAAEVVTELTGSPEGLLLETWLLADGDRWRVTIANLVGDPPHGVALASDDALVLGGFAEALNPTQQAMLLQHPRLSIPAGDVPSFAASFLPALRRLVTVEVAEDLDLPHVGAPRLTLAVGFEPGHVTRLRWGVRYQVGEAGIDVPLHPSADDPPLRDPVAEQALVESLPEGPWPSEIDADGRRHLAEDARLTSAESARFVSSWLPGLQARDDVIVTCTGEQPSYRLAEAPPLITVAVSDPDDEVTDWFNLDVTVTIDGEPVGFRELFTALALGESHLILDSGTWFSLDRPELAQLRQLIEEARQLQERGSPGLRLRTEHAGLWEELLSLGVVARQSEAWRSAASALLNLDELPAAPAPTGLAATLRPYQLLGYRWLDFLWQARLGGILADDMGLGKTMQALALVCAAKERGELTSPVLVVAPTSVIGTWAAEAARFAPGLAVEVVTQTTKKRSDPMSLIAARADIVVTSYTLLRLDDDEYVDQPWSAVMLDEAQFVKNRQARVHQSVRRLRARVKFAITGTPLENNLMDLWSLLSITAPGLFADPNVFTEVYRRPIETGSDPDALARLHRRIRPLMLRRTKEIVAAELPPKQEQVLPVTLTPAHRRLYDKHLAAERKKVLGLVGDLNRNRITILRSLTLLRQLSLSPALVDTTHPAASAKIDTLVDMLTELAAEGHRALVFSQFTTFLGMVRDRLKAEHIGASYLDGRTRDRAARIEAFRTGTDPVFLISLKAGGFGLTLIEADYVFLLDPWWNPAAEAQAIDRTHRIGQDKHVMVYRLVSADTIEEKVVALQDRKRDLFARVVGDGTDLAAPLTADDIRGLLEP